MNYYYDVLLNFDLDYIWNFYEWEKEDYLTLAKKIPLFRVSFETICDFILYHVTLKEEILDTIAHKTVVHEEKEELFASCILSDSKNAIAVLLNEQGKVISLSKLLVRDENNINEFIYTLKEEEILYEKQERRMQKRPLRQYLQMKNLLIIELNTLYESKNQQKLQYLYYEWFSLEETNLEDMYHQMQYSLSKINPQKLQDLVYLIRLSYHQV
ncbi:MAG: hypothetical protein HFH86_04465 [Bacilli bacterium]|jgi:hypothetical protein|nr:hypothetical protein [Bacilli bacterium]